MSPFSYVIGLEVHVQLKTKSKMFCRCSNEGENKEPNTTVCPVCMGHPGTLPVANSTAIRWSTKMALALNCTIAEWSKFDRKNYFYPDLPKGYQISQYDQPIGREGYLDIRGAHDPVSNRAEARIRINRLHLEEDAAKLLHAPVGNASLVDFNRAGTPLMEIVSEPDLRSPAEAKAYLQEIRLLARYLDVSSADMEKGHLRCDANISIKFDYEGTPVWTPISEIKNLNSFRAVEKALEYEGQRLYDEWISGGEVRNRTHKITVGWDDQRQATVLQRTKEEAHDYRYFPEPDIPPLRFTADTIEELRAEIPERPSAKRERLGAEFGIAADDARILVEDRMLANYFEKCASELDAWLCSLEACDEAFKAKTYRSLSTWLINKFTASLEAEGTELRETKVTPENFAELIALIATDKINSTAAQTVLSEMIRTGAEPDHIIEEKGLAQVTDASALDAVIATVIAAHPDAVEKIQAGKTSTIMFLVGQVMREMKGTAQPELVKKMLEERLGTK